VIDPNMGALVNHLNTMQAEHLATAAKELSQTRIRSIIKAKAAYTHRVLMAALDDVESQFVNGMEQVVTRYLPQLAAADAASLCKAAVHAHRLKMNEGYPLSGIEKALEQQRASASPPPARPQLSASGKGGKQPTPATDPRGWLYGVVTGSIELDLSEEMRSFLIRVTAEYLDPFIDGEVPPNQYQARSAGLFVERLEKAWATSRPARAPAKLHLAPELVLAQYVRHAIIKLNTNLGFEAHIPGIGRQPINDHERGRHSKLVGAALVQALERDFAAAHRFVGARKVTSEIIAEITSEHHRSLVLFQNELSNALVVANREGEDARQAERMRIWGYS